MRSIGDSLVSVCGLGSRSLFGIECSEVGPQRVAVFLLECRDFSLPFLLGSLALCLGHGRSPFLRGSCFLLGSCLFRGLRCDSFFVCLGLAIVVRSSAADASCLEFIDGR